MTAPLHLPRGTLKGLGLAALGFVAVASSVGTPWAQGTASRAHDTKQPIEINADSLEIRQDSNVAIFSGNVTAAQGRLRLSADSLRVLYREEKEGGEAVKATISRIDAIGNVFISSPTETAQGASGVYDVDSGMITLTGSVVVIRGENVIRGNRVALDLNSGRITMDGGEGAGERERVRAVIVPRKAPAN